MQFVTLVFASVCLSTLTSSIIVIASPNVLPRPNVAGSSPANKPIKPVILKLSLFKDGEHKRSCYGAHIDDNILRLVNWILPAECLDKTKYDMIAVKYGYNWNFNFTDSKFYLKDIWYRIHPSYNKVTKAHNIAVVYLSRKQYMDVGKQYRHVKLPQLTDNFYDKTLELYEYKCATNEQHYGEIVSLYSVKTSLVRSIWCSFLYPLSPIRKYNICTSGWLGKGLSTGDLGTLLISWDGNSFKLVGLATTLRPWTHALSLPMEFLSIQAYLTWIRL